MNKIKAAIRELAKLLLFSGIMINLCHFALAEEAPRGSITLELNTMQTVENGCAFSFLLTNALEATVDSMILEVVLFDKSGQVSQLTLFDLGLLPIGRPRLRQFIVPNSTCAEFSALLFNGAQHCEMAGTPSDICETAIELRSRVDVELLG